jgi:MoaA/NifB/PqqE/SkfB family radical SAM enzyme
MGKNAIMDLGATDDWASAETPHGTGLAHGDAFHARSIDLYVNSVCNLQCASCFLGDDYFQHAQSMSIPMVHSILVWAVEHGCEDVALLGGEPSLHPQIDALVRLPKEHGIPSTRLITNGNARARRLIAGHAHEFISRVYVSIDGARASTNDAVRGVGSFAETMKTLDLLADLQLPTTITSTITQYSFEEIDDLLELAERSFCDTLNIHWLSATGRARNSNLLLTPPEWLRVSDIVRAFRPRRPDLTVECQVAYREEWASDYRTPCLVRSRENLQFMPDGRVHLCGLTVDSPHLASFDFSSGRMVERSGTTEAHMCQRYLGPGCPIRSVEDRDGHSTEGLITSCIYERYSSAEH